MLLAVVGYDVGQRGLRGEGGTETGRTGTRTVALGTRATKRGAVRVYTLKTMLHGKQEEQPKFSES